MVKIPKLLAEVCQLPVLRLLKGVHRPISWTLIEHLYLSCKIGSPYNTSPQIPINFKIKIVILSQQTLVESVSLGLVYSTESKLSRAFTRKLSGV